MHYDWHIMVYVPSNVRTEKQTFIDIYFMMEKCYQKIVISAGLGITLPSVGRKMESRTQRIMNLLKPTNHLRLECDKEDDLSLATEKIHSNEEKENKQLESASADKNTTNFIQYQETWFDNYHEKSPSSQNCAASVGSDHLIESRNIISTPQKSITRRCSSRSSSSSSSSSSRSSSSSSNSSTTSSSTSSCDNHDTARPLLDENIDLQPGTCNISSQSILTPICGEFVPQPGTSKANISMPSLSRCDELPSVRSRTVGNYIMSPIHSEESDVDLSDDDPTYKQEHFRRRPRITATLTSIDTNNLTMTNDNIRRQSRKRKADPTKWIQNTQKMKRNLGQSYVAIHSKKLVPARNMKPPCGQKCRLK
ncbi:uncharacterized protein [Diabrotica undecimpunctata]|uniref:uncharacterized protein n=1 Tax=Diabrotica undecimpunctata TaxID=50387 RepID=UPI003B639A40